MQLIQAKITGQPRTVTTKHGDRSVVDARAANGENLTIWRPANDPAVMRLANGERVQLAIDAKGKVSLVETAFDRAEANRPERTPVVALAEIPSRPVVFSAPMEAEQKLRQQLADATPQSQTESRSAEIGEYIAKLGKLFSHCSKTASDHGGSESVALEIFRQSIKHFSL
jgi:hypothetical protein